MQWHLMPKGASSSRLSERGRRRPSSYRNGLVMGTGYFFFGFCLIIVSFHLCLSYKPKGLNANQGDIACTANMAFHAVCVSRFTK